MYTSDDYASIETPGCTFYYGYELEYCGRHGVARSICTDTHCNTEWCAYVKVGGVFELIMTTSEIELHHKGGKLSEPAHYLLAFLELYMNIDIRNKLIKKYDFRDYEE